MDEALRSSAVGRKAEAPKGLECGEEVGSGEGAVPPLHKFFFAVGSHSGEFGCILGRIFTVELLVYRLR